MCVCLIQERDLSCGYRFQNHQSWWLPVSFKYISIIKCEFLLLPHRNSLMYNLWYINLHTVKCKHLKCAINDNCNPCGNTEHLSLDVQSTLCWSAISCPKQSAFNFYYHRFLLPVLNVHINRSINMPCFWSLKWHSNSVINYNGNFMFCLLCWHYKNIGYILSQIF